MMKMDKEKIRRLDEDMQKDAAFLEDTKNNYKEDGGKMAARLSEIFRKKYASEFGGFIEVLFDLAENEFILKCGKQETAFGAAEIDLIPEQLRFFRKQAMFKKIQ